MQALEKNDEVDWPWCPEPDRPAPELRYSSAWPTPSWPSSPPPRTPSWPGGPGWAAATGTACPRTPPAPRPGPPARRCLALELQGVRPDVYAEVDGNEALVALGCGVGVVPELVRKDSPFRGRIAEVDVKRPPRGYHVSLCAKTGTLSRRTAAVLWDLAPSTASL